MQQTSWDKVADWYNEFMQNDDNYQSKVIVPNLKRLMDIRRGEMVLDLACGQGFFSDQFKRFGATVIGIDASRRLIDLARKSFPGIKFYVGRADKINFISDCSIDKVVVVLAIQNMENIGSIFRECARVLKPDGHLYLVMNHPSFRVPKASSWGWDDENGIQYRRIDQYLSESKVKIQMRPGVDPENYTLSFHRPFQFYIKTLRNNGFLLRSLEEWESNRKSQSGPRSRAEDMARKEIPLFACLEAIKTR